MNLNEINSVLGNRRKLVDAHSDAEQAAIVRLGSGRGGSTSFLKDKFKPRGPFSGLMNQGATCYLDSLLQTLYMTPEFRQAVLKWRDPQQPKEALVTEAAIEKQRKVESLTVALQLQRLFQRMSLSKQAAQHTGPLTRAFGWKPQQLAAQQDVGEMLHNLIDALLAQTKGTSIAEFVDPSLHGLESSYCKCLECNVDRVTAETRFLVTSLAVESSSSLKEALLKYVQPELMDGDNALRCPGMCGDHKQPHLRGTRIGKLPYIFNLQLQRFSWDWNAGERIKIRSFCSFPRVLDLTDVLHKESEAEEKRQAEGGINVQQQKSPVTYELYSVLMHSGTPHAGHYFCYIRDFAAEAQLDKEVEPVPEHGVWYEFNDCSVHRLSEENVQLMFSTEPPAAEEESCRPQARAGAQKNSPPAFVDPRLDAYFLVYRRVDPKANLSVVRDEDWITPEFQNVITMENEAFQVQKAEFERLKSLVQLHVHWRAPGTPADEATGVTKVEVDKQFSMAQTFARVWEALQLEARYGIGREDMRLRSWDVMKDRADRPYAPEDLGKPITSPEFNILDLKHMLLESKAAGSEWPVYQPPMTTLRYQWLHSWPQEAQAQEHKQASVSGSHSPDHLLCPVMRLIQVPEDQPTVAECKNAIASDLRKLLSGDLSGLPCLDVRGGDDEAESKDIELEGVHFEALQKLAHSLSSARELDDAAIASRLALACVTPDNRAGLVDEDQVSLWEVLGSTSGSRIVAEILNTQGEQSNLVEYFERSRFTCVFKLQLDWAESKEVTAIQVDLRSTLQDFRRQLAARVGLDALQFKVGRSASPGFGSWSELQNPERTLKAYKLHDGDTILLKKGRPLEKGMREFNVLLWRRDLPTDHPLAFSEPPAAESKPEKMAVLAGGQAAVDMDMLPPPPLSNGVVAPPLSNGVLLPPPPAANAAAGLLSPPPLDMLTPPPPSGLLSPPSDSAVKSAPPPPLLAVGPPSLAMGSAPSGGHGPSSPEFQRHFVQVPYPVVAGNSWTAREVVESIKEQLGTWFAENQIPETFRIRMRTGLVLKDVWLPTSTVRQNCPPVRRVKEIVIQPVFPAPQADSCEGYQQEELTEDHVLLSFRRWHPQTQTLDRSAGEEAVLKTWSVAQLKEHLAPRLDFPLKFLRIEKPRSFHLASQPPRLANLGWGFGIPESTKLCHAPLSCHHGDIIVYKDSRETEVPLAKTAEELENERELALAMEQSRAADEGVSLRILTLEEQLLAMEAEAGHHHGHAGHEEWNCAMCTYLNQATMLACEICTSPKNS